MAKNSGRRWLLTGVFFLILLVGTSFLLLRAFPNLANINFYKTYVLEKIESQLNATVKFSEGSLSIFPEVKLHFESVALLERDDEVPLFSADHLVLDLSFLSLFRREIVVKRLELDGPRFNLRSDHPGRIHFSDLFITENGAGTPVASILGFSSSVQEVMVRNGKIRLTPDKQGDSLPDIHLDQVNLAVITPSPDAPLEFSISGVMPQREAHAKISVTGTFASQIGQQASSKSLNSEYKFSGTTRVTSLDMANFQSYLGTKQDSGLYGFADLEAEVTAILSSNSRQLYVENINIRLEDGSLVGAIAFQQAGKEPWTFESKISTSVLDIATTLTAFSPHINETMFYHNVSNADISGNIRVVRSNLSGVLNAPFLSNISTFAEFELENLNGYFGEERTPFRGINAAVLLENDSLELQSLSGRYSQSKVLSGTGIVTRLYDEADIDTKISLMVPSSDFLDFLVDLDEPEDRSKSIWGYKTSTGSGRLILNVLGSLRDGELEFEGIFRGRDIAFHSTWLDLPVSKLFGQVYFSPEGVEVSDVKGKVGRSRTKVDAQFFGNDSNIIVKSSADARELLELLVSKGNISSPLPDTLVSGITVFDLRVQKRQDKTIISTQLDLKKTEYSDESGTNKPAGTSANINAELVLERGNRIKIQKIQLDLMPLILHIFGDIVLTDPPQYLIEIDSNSVRLDELHERTPDVSIQGVYPEKGLFQTNLKITNVEEQPDAMGISGKVSLLDGRILVVDETTSELVVIDDVNVDLQFSNQDNGRVNIQTLSGEFEGSDVDIKGTVTGLRVFPHIRMVIDVPHFDFGAMFSSDEPSSFGDMVTSLSRTTTLQSDIHVGVGEYSGVKWHNMHVVATGQDGVITLELLRARNGDGTLQADATIYMPENESVHMDTHANFTGVPIEDIVALLDGNENLMFGRANIKGGLSGGGHEQGIARTLDGDIYLTVSDGRIRKFTALSKMLNLLNLPQLLSGHVPDLSSKGLAFDSIIATLAMDKGVMSIKNLSLNSPILKIAGAGRYDIPNDHVDAVMAISPLGSYENILNNIPVLNKIFAGGDQRRGILTAVFEVKGPLDDPEVTMMPGESVTSGLTGLGELVIDILRNTILLPKELIAPDISR